MSVSTTDKVKNYLDEVYALLQQHGADPTLHTLDRNRSHPPLSPSCDADSVTV